MGKVVILGGNARSGKSTLANRLTKKGFSKISFDNLYHDLEEGLKIKIEDFPYELQFSFFESIVNTALKEIEIEDINIVIDMYDFMPSDIEKLKNKEKLEVYFLAYPNCSLEEIKYNVIHYAKPTDWIAQVEEEYLNSCVKRFYERNQILVKECEKYQMKLIDTMTGENRKVVLSQLLEIICENKGA